MVVEMGLAEQTLRATEIISVWVTSLTHKQLRDECERYGLDTAGIVLTLRKWLHTHFRETGSVPDELMEELTKASVTEEAERASIGLPTDVESSENGNTSDEVDPEDKQRKTKV